MARRLSSELARVHTRHSRNRTRSRSCCRFRTSRRSIRRLCRSGRSKSRRGPNRNSSSTRDIGSRSRTGLASRCTQLELASVPETSSAQRSWSAPTWVRTRRSHSSNSDACSSRCSNRPSRRCRSHTSCRSIQRMCTLDRSTSRTDSNRNSSSSSTDIRSSSRAGPAGASTRSDSVSEPALSSGPVWLETAWARTRHSFRNRRCRSHTSCRTAAGGRSSRSDRSTRRMRSSSTCRSPIACSRAKSTSPRWGRRTRGARRTAAWSGAACHELPTGSRAPPSARAFLNDIKGVLAPQSPPQHQTCPRAMASRRARRSSS